MDTADFVGQLRQQPLQDDRQIELEPASLRVEAGEQADVETAGVEGGAVVGGSALGRRSTELGST